MSIQGMAIVSTEDLEEGMEVEEPVKNLQGQLLFGVGHVLLQKHIDMMLAWGIPEANVKIEEEEDDEAAQRKREILEKAEKELEPIFKRCDVKDPVVEEIFRFCTERIVNAQKR